MRWEPTWTQAITDFHGEDDEPPFDDVTVRMTMPATFGGSAVRAELSNRFGHEPVRIVGAPSPGFSCRTRAGEWMRFAGQRRQSGSDLLQRSSDVDGGRAGIGAAHGALAMTTPGDTSMANLAEVSNLVGGGSLRVRR
jgi:hypothetical protein